MGCAASMTSSSQRKPSRGTNPKKSEPEQTKGCRLSDVVNVRVGPPRIEDGIVVQEWTASGPRSVCLRRSRNYPIPPGPSQNEPLFSPAVVTMPARSILMGVASAAPQTTADTLSMTTRIFNMRVPFPLNSQQQEEHARVGLQSRTSRAKQYRVLYVLGPIWGVQECKNLRQLVGARQRIHESARIVFRYCRFPCHTCRVPAFPSRGPRRFASARSGES